MNLTDQSLLLSTALGVGVFLLYLITLAIYWWRQRMRLSVIIYRGLLFGIIAAAFLYTLAAPKPNGFQFLPFGDWRRLNELGHMAVWKRAAMFGVPFMMVGFFLPLGFRKINRFSIMLLIGLSLAVLFALLRFVFGAFDVDEIIYVFWGAMVGYAFITFFAGLIPKLRVFASMHFNKSAYIIGVLLLMGTFFAGVGMLLLENGSDFVELQLAGGTPLPDSISVNVSLSNQREKISTFVLEPGDMETEPQHIAQALGMKGAPVLEGESQGSAVLNDEGKSLTYYSSGNWTYDDLDAAERSGSLPDDETCIRLAEELVASVSIQKYEIHSIVVEDLGEGATSKEVWVHAAADGRKVIGACEFHIWIGASGDITRIMRIDSNLKPFTKVRIISSQDAYALVLSGGKRDDGKTVPIANTHYGENPVAVKITRADICYWLESAKGILQPIWCFTAQGEMSDGSSTSFEIYVPAIRY